VLQNSGSDQPSAACGRACRVSEERGTWSVVGDRCEDGETSAEMASCKAAEETASFRDLEAGVALRFVDAAIGEFLAGGRNPGRCRD